MIPHAPSQNQKGWASPDRDRSEPEFMVGPTGVVHHINCSRVTATSNHWEWAPKLAIATDRAHKACLPGGLPK